MKTSLTLKVCSPSALLPAFHVFRNDLPRQTTPSGWSSSSVHKHCTNFSQEAVQCLWFREDSKTHVQLQSERWKASYRAWRPNPMGNKQQQWAPQVHVCALPHVQALADSNHDLDLLPTDSNAVLKRFKTTLQKFFGQRWATALKSYSLIVTVNL